MFWQVINGLLAQSEWTERDSKGVDLTIANQVLPIGPQSQEDPGTSGALRMGNLDRDRLDCGDFQTATAVAEILRPRLHARRGSSCNHAVQKMPSVHKQDIASQAQGFDRVSEGRSKKIPCYQHLGLGRRRRPGGFRAIS